MMMLLTLAAIAVFLTAAYFSPLIWRTAFNISLKREVSARHILALTYDDGPSEILTPRLLDLLREKNAKATFFMLGNNAKRFPHIVDRVLREGHDIGCHSERHIHAWKSFPWASVEDINAGFESLSPWVRPEGMFRPPYGKMTFPTILAIWRRGASIWWWTFDSKDTSDVLPSTAELSGSVLREKGAIVLMHDLDRSPDRNEFILESTAALLDMAHQEQMQILPLSKLFQ
jgi:peptidoglycan-N-acetylglucosamine deacetylase